MTAGRASAVPAKRHSNTAMKIVGKDCAVTGEQLQRADQRAEVHARETLGDFPGFRKTALDGAERFAGAIVHRLEIADGRLRRSEEHTSELQSLMRISYAVFCLKKKDNKNQGR